MSSELIIGSIVAAIIAFSFIAKLLPKPKPKETHFRRGATIRPNFSVSHVTPSGFNPAHIKNVTAFILITVQDLAVWVLLLYLL